MQIRPIRSSQDYHSAVAAIAPFAAKTALTQDESDYLEVMQILIRTYRQEHREEEPTTFTYDLERMKQHIECGTVSMPSHIRSANEIKAWLLSDE